MRREVIHARIPYKKAFRKRNAGPILPLVTSEKLFFAPH